MAKSRKITCDCGKVLVEKKVLFDHFETEAMVCPQGHFTTLTKEQAENYVKLKQLHAAIDAERKVIKIGNSMGVTFPEQLQELGVHVGSKVRLEALSANTFKIEIM